MSKTRPHVASEELRWLENAIASFNDTAGRLEGAYRDLEAEKRRIDLELESKNHELESTVGKLNALLASTTAGVVSTDSKGIVRSMNRAAETMLGIETEGWEGGSLTAISRHSETLGRLLSCGEAGSVREAKVRCADGVERCLRVSVSMIQEGAGRAAGTMWTITDLSELRSLEESLAQRNRMAEMGEMSSVLAHQIRNPLHGIAGFGRLILERVGGDNPSEVRRFAVRIIEGSAKLEGLVEELLRFTRDDTRDEVRLDLGEIVARAAEVACSLGQNDVPAGPSARVVVVRRDEPLLAIGDSAQLREAIANLIANARQAVGPQGTVRVSAHREGGSGVVRVHDDGPGMDAATRERVFHPFFTTKESGVGLGLPIARKLIERHRGSLSLRSRAGAGCRARIELPLVPGGSHDGPR